MSLWPGIVVVYGLALLALAVYGLNHATLSVIFSFGRRQRRPTPPVRLPADPIVTIQLPLYNELYVAERVIRSACEVDYPLHLLEIQVLDDSTDETLELTRALAAEYQARGVSIVHLHRPIGKGSKRAHWRTGWPGPGANSSRSLTPISSSPGTSCAGPSSTLRTRRSASYRRGGRISTRRSRELTRVMALALDGHFVVEQSARYWAGWFLNFNGTAGILRTRAIADAGGWQDDTDYRRPRPQLPRTARGVAGGVPPRRGLRIGDPDRHSQHQDAAISMDQGSAGDRTEDSPRALAIAVATRCQMRRHNPPAEWPRLSTHRSGHNAEPARNDRGRAILRACDPTHPVGQLVGARRLFRLLLHRRPRPRDQLAVADRPIPAISRPVHRYERTQHASGARGDLGEEESVRAHPQVSRGWTSTGPSHVSLPQPRPRQSGRRVCARWHLARVGRVRHLPRPIRSRSVSMLFVAGYGLVLMYSLRHMPLARGEIRAADTPGSVPPRGASRPQPASTAASPSVA